MTPQHLRWSCVPQALARYATPWSLAGMLFTMGACRDLAPPLPAGTPDPSTLRTAEGARSLYLGTLRFAVEAGVSVLLDGGLLTDELQSTDIGNPADAGRIPALSDARSNARWDGATGGSYDVLHAVRNNAIQAIAFLRTYAPASPPALQGEMYAWQGYAEVMLAELYCSGIPLSTVDVDGDFTYRAGSPRDEVFTHAVALFDSALAISGDSLRIMHFARIGKGRALLNLGQFAAAAATTRDVPNGYEYTLPMAPPANTTFAEWKFAGYTVANIEGGNGLPFRRANDARVTVRSNGKLRYVNDSTWLPGKYDQTGDVVPVVIASAIEARLIEAEAALRENRPADWVTILNGLRGSAITPAISALPPDSATTASGAVADSVRVTVHFRERAFWLFLTGHRQGDLRRLVRQYSRHPERVYPTGFTDPGGFGRYGTAITFKVDEYEQLVNTLYKGCNDRNA